MPKMTIAQLRERDINRLVSMKTAEPGADDYREARRVMNSYYRLCGLSERNLYLSNNEKTCNTRWCLESEDRESHWYNRLNETFKTVYGLRLVYFGYFPSIATAENCIAIDPKFYD